MKPIQILQTFTYCGETLAAKQPIVVLSSIEDGFYCLDYPNLDIHAAGETFSEALEDFNAEIISLYHYYDGCMSDSDPLMTDDLREKRAFLLGLLKPAH